MNKAIILLLSIFLISSCADEEISTGEWDDIIKLSIKNVEFGAEADSVLITTQGSWWWIDAISVDNNTYSYYNREDIDLESESYTIIGNCFLVERRDKNTLFVRMDENLTGEERLMVIVLEAGNYFDYVNIRQSGESK